MKMVTKTFPAGWYGAFDIDHFVNAKLRSHYSFDSWFDRCVVWCNHEVVAQCPTPPAMQEARKNGTSCTFSVTLPAEWWK